MQITRPAADVRSYPLVVPPVFGFRFGPGTPAHGCPSDCWDHSGYCRDGYRCIHPQEALVKKLLLAGIAASMVYTIAARAADDDPPPHHHPVSAPAPRTGRPTTSAPPALHAPPS